MTQVVSQPQKDMRARVAVALLCGLAVACCIMTFTADADQEVILKEETGENVQRVVSVDVDKVGRIYSAVPKEYKGITKGGDNGRVRLLNYFKDVERRIAAETAARKADITSIRAKMAKNRAYNAKARSTMKKMLLAKMAVNAKKAKDDLDKEMAKTARTFAKQAALANKRNKATIRRARKTRRIMRRNKKAAHEALTAATHAQQRALSALDAATNARIHKTEKSIAANAAQIKINAKKARDALDRANKRFDNKMFAMKKDAANARSKLAQQAKDMDKKVRAMISGKIKGIAMKTASQFAKVRKKMADDRHHADHALAAVSTRMTAALNAAKALQDKRFAQTVADIAAAKKEANDRINKAKMSFKVNLMHLASTVKEQVTHLNAGVTQLQGTITKNKLAQADVQRHVNAELKRMVKLGNDRETDLAKKDKALADLMKHNKEANSKAMEEMAAKFTTQLDAIKKQMKKDRAHTEHQLKKSTDGLYATMAKNQEQQDKANKAQQAATRRMKLDAEDALRDAKASFALRLGKLTATVHKNDKKADAKIKKLAGVVDDEAAKSKAGREALKKIQDSNKAELKTAIADAVHQGEQRALQVEKTASDMNKKTREAMNMKITGQISILTKSIHASVEDLRLSTDEARKAMKREILYAVRSAAQEAKENLASVVKWSNKEFNSLNKKLDDNNKASAAERAAIESTVAADKILATRAIKDAAAEQARALLALKTVTAKKIKKTNTDVAAYGKRIEKQAKDVAAQMASNAKTLEAKINGAKKGLKEHLTAANKASVDRHVSALSYVQEAISGAEKDAETKFAGFYVDLAKDREDFDLKVASASVSLQQKIAKRSALFDTRFAKEVAGSMAEARKFATEEVELARQQFTTSLVAIESTIANMDERIGHDVIVVAEEFADHKEVQRKRNLHVAAELKRIEDLSDTRHTENKRFRGKIRKVIIEHKELAAKERTNLRKKASAEYTKLKAKLSADRAQAAGDLTTATRTMYDTIFKAKESTQKEHEKHVQALGVAKANVAAKQKEAEGDFQAKMMTLTNTVVANNNKYELGLAKITGVVHDWKQTDTEQREMMKDQVKSMENDLQRSIVKAIGIGEAEMKKIEERALENSDAVTKSLQGEIVEQVEAMADDVFQAVLENRGQIADNYLALKGYAGAMAGDIIDAVTKGQGKALFSVGDFLQTVAALSEEQTKVAEGVTAGLGEMPAVFSGKPIKVSTSYSKTNGLVIEYTKAMTMVRQRWPFGIGKYLLSKIQRAMQGPDGVLSVGTLDHRDGQFVSINPHALGLSNRVEEFDKLAATAHAYQGYLRKLTTKLPKKVKKKAFFVDPVQTGGEWDGD
jgi:hypothetical protein